MSGVAVYDHHSTEVMAGCWSTKRTAGADEVQLSLGKSMEALKPDELEDFRPTTDQRAPGRFGVDRR